eukprot:gb/GECG01003367.1/.p1 GENE.gb/GECG01003367.1/~~gb/GECG01003367.1/.p1  ORF type:complete len:586 (+),score=56.01 gb/GECG01003367.1/:1-1758(+)
MVATRKWPLILVVALITGHVSSAESLVGKGFTLEDVNHKVPVYNSLQDRLEQYCHPPYTGEEGEYEGPMEISPVESRDPREAEVYTSGRSNSSFTISVELTGVWGLLRHGDRSGFAQIQGADSASWDCDFGSDTTLPPDSKTRFHAEYVSRQAIEEGLECAELELDERCDAGAHRHDHLEAANAARGFKASEAALKGESAKHCRAGMLTKEGIEQHRRLGRLFRQKYGSLLKRISHQSHQETGDNPVDVKDVFCSSTDYPRTALSAASFLDGLHLAEESNFTIYVQPREKDPALVQELLRRCNKFSSDVDEHTYHFSRFNTLPMNLIRRIAQLTNCTKEEIDNSLDQLKHHGDQLSKGAVFPGYAGGLQKPNPLQGKTPCPPLSNDATLVADMMVTRQCHNIALPCKQANKDGESCIEENTALEAIEQADRDYARRYSGSPNNFLIHPLLSQISNQLGTQAECLRQRTSRCRKFWFLFAHDITVYPVASALNLTDYQWPSYASRIVLEMFSSRRSEEHFIRALYQGKDMTSELSCSAVYRTTMYGNAREEIVLCRLDHFRRLIDSMLPIDGDVASWQQACDNSNG